MKQQHRKQSVLVPVLGNIVLALLGLTIAMGLIEMVIRAFPNWIPSEIRVNPPSRRVKAFLDETYYLRHSDGDLLYYMREDIVPLSPEQDEVVAHIHMVTDADGFRNSPPEKDTYSIVALGDSFTRASGVATPWPQKLAEYTGSDVLNLGDVGFGPQDELKVLQQYGLKKLPQWVIMAYFEGNDLYDAASYELANPLILFRFGRYILNRGLEAWQNGNSGGAQAATVPTYRYPLTITINHKELEMVFFPAYTSWLSLSKEEIAASQNYHLVKEAILQVQELSEAAGANFLLVYVPSKSHVYLPYLEDAEAVERIYADVPRLALDEKGLIQFTDRTATPQLTRQHMDDQVHLLADFALDHDIRFLNLTPAFQEEASVGAELYYPFDTHWNQTGNTLAAKTIYNYINELLPNTEIETPGN